MKLFFLIHIQGDPGQVDANLVITKSFHRKSSIFIVKKSSRHVILFFFLTKKDDDFRAYKYILVKEQAHNVDELCASKLCVGTKMTLTQMLQHSPNID